MSGIAGIVRLHGAPVRPGEIEGMLDVLARRGPDARSARCGGNAAFGQTLLATTPEALVETQPWAHRGSGCVVVSDSRLDNRPELLRMLGIGHRHADDVGDAALLCAAFERWGVECADRLLGDFAFVIWDPRNRKLFCARDVMGVRPFYYYHAPGRLFAFASEPEALLTLSDIPNRLDEGRIADVLVGQLEGIDKTSTFFEDILRLPPASVLAIANGSLDIREYWTPTSRPPSDVPATESAWIDELRETLTRSVRRRLRASVRVGSMLSGGLDSSSIVALASELVAAQGNAPLATFSAVSSEPDCPETKAIETMLAHFDLQATRLDCKSNPGMLETVVAGWSSMGEPFDASMTMIDCQYASAAQQGVRVVFDGIDGDNLFSEGDHLARLLRQGHWLDVWQEVRGQVRFYGSGTSTWTTLRPLVSSALVPPTLRRLVNRRRAQLASGRGQKSMLIAPALARRIDLENRLQRLNEATAAQGRYVCEGRGYSSIGSNFTTVGVERYGRVAARRGVEPRHPFLDRQLLEFCAWLPLELRTRYGYPKWALRKAMAARLPAPIAWRRGKEHLGWSFNHALLSRLGGYLPGPESGPDGALREYVNSEFLRQVSGDGGPWSPRDERWGWLLTTAALQAWLRGRSLDMRRPAG